MKKVLILLFSLCMSISSFAQEMYFIYQKSLEFKTPDGKDFVVFDCPEKTAAELTASVKDNFTKIKGFRETLTDDALQTEVTIDLFQRPIVTLRGQDWYADITIKMQFKDGRFRIIAPVIKQFYRPDPLFGKAKGPDGVLMTVCTPQDALGMLERRHVFNPTNDKYYDFNRSISALILKLISVPVNDDEW